MLSPVLVRRLEDLWPGSLHVVTEFGERCPDDSVWVEARRLGLVIITKDRDYADAARFPGPPPQVVRLLVLNAGTTPSRYIFASTPPRSNSSRHRTNATSRFETLRRLAASSCCRWPPIRRVRFETGPDRRSPRLHDRQPALAWLRAPARARTNGRPKARTRASLMHSRPPPRIPAGTHPPG